MEATLRMDLRQLELLHELVKKKQGQWKGISKASKVLGFSRPTIYKALELYPEMPKNPKKIIPNYVQEFEGSPTVQSFRQKYEGTLVDFKPSLSTGLKAWKILGKKDPLCWNKADFEKLWHHETFRDSMTGKIRPTRAVQLRLWMRHIRRHDLLEEFKTKGLKRPKGMKKLWYLTLHEVKALMKAIDRLDILLLARVGLETGSRISALVTITPNTIDFENNVVMVYERKVKEWVSKTMRKEVMDMIRQYIEDHEIKPNERLFPFEPQTYRKQLKTYGKKAGISKTTSPHILKHSFVTQASAHNVSMEVISQQTGTDPQTLKDFYLFINPDKMRSELGQIKW